VLIKILRYFRKIGFMPFLVSIKFKITKIKLTIVKIVNWTKSILNNPIKVNINKTGYTTKHTTNKSVEASLFTSLVFERANVFLSIIPFSYNILNFISY